MVRFIFVPNETAYPATVIISKEGKALFAHVSKTSPNWAVHQSGSGTGQGVGERQFLTAVCQ